jgi:hypothetical protein
MKTEYSLNLVKLFRDAKTSIKAGHEVELIYSDSPDGIGAVTALKVKNYLEVYCILIGISYVVTQTEGSILITPLEREMKTFYVTIASNQPRGPGYYEIKAPTLSDARQVAFNQCPDGRWSFLYTDLDDVHEFDRTCLGTLHAPKSLVRDRREG